MLRRTKRELVHEGEWKVKEAKHLVRLMAASVALCLLLATLGCTGGGSVEKKPAEPAWPSKDITFIVPFKAGGGYDIQARIVAPLIEKYLPRKANVIVNNQPAAGGKVGSLALMKSPPDGHTIGLLSPAALGVMQVNGELEGLDIRELTWLGQVSWDAGVLVASAKSGFKRPEDLKKREVRFGVTANAYPQAVLLANKLGLKARMVMFEGSAEEVLACMRGDIDLMINSWPTSKQMVEDSQGSIVPLFVVADDRVPQWNEVPSSKELGLDLKELYALEATARVLAAPGGLAPDVRAALEDVVSKALHDPEFAANMEKAGYVPGAASAAEAREAVAAIITVLERNKDILQSLSK